MQFLTEVIWILFFIVQAIFALYILIPFLAVSIYFFLNLFKIKGPYEKRNFLSDKEYEFGIIITAHQETRFIFPLIDSILKQTYRKFRVYVVADDCEITSLQFNDERIFVLKPPVPLHAKIKSIHYAITNFKTTPDAIIIFDTDNLIHASFLEVMNNYFRKGYKVVQADFKPKNTDTSYARMDAIGDMFNFFIEREIRMRLGLSSAIWGSGVAIDYDLYNEVKYSDFLGGFDKKLQSHLVLRVKRIAFAPQAILYDEKIDSGKSLENQRTRWISSYFKYFNESMKIFLSGIRKANFNLLYFGFIILRPPLFIILGGGVIITIANYFLNIPLFLVGIGLLVSFFLSFITIVLIKGKDKRFIATLFLIPLFILRQVAALLKLKKAKKSFLKTQHSRLVYIDELKKK